MKLIYFCVVSVFFIILVLPFILSLLLTDIPNNFQPALGETQLVYGELTLKQVFISQEDNLVGFGLSIKNPYLRNRKDLIVDVFSSNNVLLRTLKINGSSIPDGELIKLRFEPILGSKDQEFYLEISAPYATNEDSLEIFITRGLFDWGKGLYVNDDLSEYNISFITLHRPPSSLINTFQIFSKWGSKLLADSIFAGFYLMSLIGVTVYLVSNKLKH